VAGQEVPDRAAGGHVPQPDRVLVAAAGQGLAVRAERPRRDPGYNTPKKLWPGSFPLPRGGRWFDFRNIQDGYADYFRNSMFATMRHRENNAYWESLTSLPFVTSVTKQYE